MKNFFSNLGYFIKEAKTIFRVDFLSNIFSILSIGLIFFILSMIFSGWEISNSIVEVLEKEAEINLFYDENMEGDKIGLLIEKIESIKGIRGASLINEEESYHRMVEILGKEAKILELFDENPFSPFIEVKIQIEEIETILNRLELLDGVEYVRDNKEIIDKMKNMITILTLVGILVITAVGISTMIVVSHIIRQGIYNNREQINTLKLLGAPNSFIGLPFLLEGMFLTIGGGVLAFILVAFLINYAYGQIGNSLLFIPLPNSKVIINDMLIFILSLSVTFGIIGSLFGLSSAKND